MDYSEVWLQLESALSAVASGLPWCSARVQMVSPSYSQGQNSVESKGLGFPTPERPKTQLSNRPSPYEAGLSGTHP